MLSLLLALLSQRATTVQIPGSTVSFELVQVEGRAGLLPFEIGRCEVTWREFLLYYGPGEDGSGIASGVDGITRPSGGYSYLGQANPPKGALEPNRPAMSLRWHSAMQYCAWLSKKTGDTYRLPTEREWEAACRAGETGEGPDDPDAAAWHGGNSGGTIHPVGTKAANAWGLHDMLGNAWEYCLEHHAPPDFLPVVRGGAWNSPPEELRFARRQKVRVEWCKGDPQLPKSVWWFQAGFSQGFRVVRVPRAKADGVTVRITTKETELRRDTAEPRAIFTRVEGEVVNGGAATLVEVELLVYPLDPDGEPVLRGANSQNAEARAIFSRCHPVLANSAHEGPHRNPLEPGERRGFAVDLPYSQDGDDYVAPGKFGARVTAVRAAP